MHPLVRKLYKEALYVGRDYPLGLDKVRQEWKKAIRNPKNCPSCYDFVGVKNDVCDDKTGAEWFDHETDPVAIPKKIHSKEHPNPDCERELRKAVGKGRYMIREMIGVIQLKKYRSLRQRYDDSDYSGVESLKEKLVKLQEAEKEKVFESRGDVPNRDA